jgi:hypothetical protein
MTEERFDLVPPHGLRMAFVVVENVLPIPFDESRHGLRPIAPHFQSDTKPIQELWRLRTAGRQARIGDGRNGKGHDRMKLTGIGTAKITVTFADWRDAKIEPLTLELPVQDPEPAKGK